MCICINASQKHNYEFIKIKIIKIFTYDALIKSLKDTQKYYILFRLNTCIKIYSCMRKINAKYRIKD